MVIDVIKNKTIPLGRIGENEARQIRFDVGEILASWPAAAFTLLNQRPQDDAAYPVVSSAIRMEGTRLIWTVASGDVARTGHGRLELVARQDDVIVKSVIYSTITEPALDGSGEVPEPWESWVGEVTDAADRAEAAAELLESPGAEATTLEPGQEATASYSGGVFSFGIPKGDKGDKGDTGATGPQGPQGPAGDPTELIDDTTTTATDRAWSASKTAGELNNLNGAINQKYTKPNDGIPATDLASGVIPSVPVTDVTVNGTSVLNNGTAVIPAAETGTFGAVKLANGAGLYIHSTDSSVRVQKSDSSLCKAGTHEFRPIVPYCQHQSVFYGLAKAAGADMASVSGATVGVYPDAQRSAISQMLNAPETVSGTTPSITAKAGVRYVCGEVATLTITAPASGCIDVTFTSGSTATVLTVSSAKTGVTAIKWANGFDPSSLDANTRYEVLIDDGEWGMVASWT